MIRKIFSIGLAFLFGSCSAVYNINISKKVTADVSLVVDLNVEGDNDGETEMREDEKEDAVNQLNEFYDSPLISEANYNFDNSVIEIFFTISDVDSLGNYISPLYEYPVHFELKDKQFKITGTDGKLDPESDIGGYSNMITIDMTIRFKRKIISVEHSESIHLKSGKKHVQFTTSLGEMDFSGEENYLIVNLK